MTDRKRKGNSTLWTLQDLTLAKQKKNTSTGKLVEKNQKRQVFV